MLHKVEDNIRGLPSQDLQQGWQPILDIDHGDAKTFGSERLGNGFILLRDRRDMDIIFRLEFECGPVH